MVKRERKGDIHEFRGAWRAGFSLNLSVTSKQVACPFKTAQPSLTTNGSELHIVKGVLDGLPHGRF